MRQPAWQMVLELVPNLSFPHLESHCLYRGQLLDRQATIKQTRIRYFIFKEINYYQNSFLNLLIEMDFLKGLNKIKPFDNTRNRERIKSTFEFFVELMLFSLFLINKKKFCRSLKRGLKVNIKLKNGKICTKLEPYQPSHQLYKISLEKYYQNKMLSQSQPIPCNRLTSPIVHRTSGPKKVNVYFTYQTSPHQSLKQSLTMIKQQQQQKHRKPIFQSRRKLSFKSIESKKRSSRLKIFQEASKKPTTLQSHIFLKESHVSKGSSPQTIVDQLEKLEQQTNLVNPITRKLSQMKNRNGTKGTFYSNTEKNSMMFTQRPQLRRNRIQSQVLHYQYSPMKKNRSSVTIKATKENRQYGVSKFSNGLSIITNQDDNMFEGFRDCGEVETPKYHRSTYRAMKRSFDPGLFVDHERKEEVKKVSEVHPQQHTDRFYDQSSLQTPRLPTVSKKISYQVINPLTSSLRQQKLQKKKQRQSLIQQASAKKQNKLKTLLLIVITMISSFITTSTAKVSHLIRKSINFTHSQTFFMIVIITLSLAVFVVQLVQ